MLLARSLLEKNMKIMIVDDAAFMRKILKDMLIQYGFEVAGEAVNGRQLLELYPIVKPDIVTLDITMPEMDGITALKELKKKFPNAKVVMCSAMGQQTMVIEAIQAGASDFIVKPFKEDKVIGSLNKLSF